jgi:hypothetical protein
MEGSWIRQVSSLTVLSGGLRMARMSKLFTGTLGEIVDKNFQHKQDGDAPMWKVVDSKLEIAQLRYCCWGATQAHFEGVLTQSLFASNSSTV